MNLASAENSSRTNSYSVRLPAPGWSNDYWLLPLLSVGTAVLLFLAAEVTARLIWPEAQDEACLVHEATGGAHFRPNCTSPMKIVEGGWTTDTYNECGYRTSAHCGPKPAGTIRVDMLGASFVHGRGVPYEQTFATRIGQELKRQLGHPVEIENLGVFQQRPIDSYRRLSEALALNPDALVFVTTPSDLAKPVSREEMAARDLPAMEVQHASKPKLNLVHQIHDWFLQDSRTMIITQSLVLRDPGTFQRIHLSSATNRAEMPNTTSPEWAEKFADMRVLLNGMADKARKANVPFVVVAIPMRIQTTLMQSEQPDPTIDPFVFSKELNKICQDNGATFVDLFQGFDRVPNANRLYFVVDAHLTPQGHAVVAQELTPPLKDVLAKKIGGQRT